MTDDSAKTPSEIEFEWDHDKRLQIMERRGIDFVDVAQILAERVHEYRSDRNEEERWVAIGALENGPLIAVVYTMRGEKFRVITARRARADEQRAYLHALSTAPNERPD